MPQLKTISQPGLIIGTWPIDESAAELEKTLPLTDEELHRLSRFSNDRRKWEFLVIRKLLQRLTDGNYKLTYNQEGRPKLVFPQKQISISHSRSLAAVILADFPVGIDVEDCDRKVEKVARRFLSSVEMKWTQNSGNVHLNQLLCWCAKEAIFKMAKTSDVDYARDITILPRPDTEDEIWQAALNLVQPPKKIVLQHTKIANNVMVWSVYGAEFKRI